MNREILVCVEASFLLLTCVSLNNNNEIVKDRFFYSGYFSLKRQ